MADRRGSNAKSDSHDPLAESLEELNRIADDLVDGLSLEGDAPGAGLAAGPETSPSPDAEAGAGASTVEELTRRIEHPDAVDAPDDGPSGDEVADLFAHVDSLLASKTEPEAVEEPQTDGAPDDTELHQADARQAEAVGEETIELDAEDLDAAEEAVDELQATGPEFGTPADANIDLPPTAEASEAEMQSGEELADPSLLEEAIAEFADEPVAEFADEPVAEFADEPVAEFTDEPVAEFADEPVAEFTDEPVAEFADEPVAEFADEPVAEFTDEPVAELADEPVAELADEPVAELTDEPVATEFEKEPDAGVIPWPPQVPDQTAEAAGMTADESAHAESVATAAEPVFERPAPRPSRTPWVIAAVFVTAALGVAAWWLLFQQPTPPPMDPTKTSTVAPRRATATPPARTAPVVPDSTNVEPLIDGPATDPAAGSGPTSATMPPSSEDVEDAGATSNSASATTLTTPSRARLSASGAERRTPAAAKPTGSTATPSPPASTDRSAQPTPPRRTEEQVQRSFGQLRTGAAARAGDSTGDSTGDSESESTVREPTGRPDLASAKLDGEAPTTGARTRAPAESRPTAESSSVGLAGPTGPDTDEPQAIPIAPKIQPFRPPEVLERVEPAYPPRALKRGEGGTIVLKVLVDEEGRVARVVVEQGLDGSELEAAAIGAVLRWRYRPASENGHEIRGWTTETFVFEPAE